MKHPASLRNPRYHLPTFLAAMIHTSAFTPKTNLECSVGPLAASNVQRSSRHICQLFDCPPGLRSSPPTFPSITRLGDRPCFCRATAPAKKSRRLRMVVSMLSHCVLLRAFAHERVSSVRCRRRKLMARRRTRWGADRSLAKFITLRVHVAHPYINLRSPRRLGKACCEACPIRLGASGVGLSGRCKAGLTLKECYLHAATCGRKASACW